MRTVIAACMVAHIHTHEHTHMRARAPVHTYLWGLQVVNVLVKNHAHVKMKRIGEIQKRRKAAGNGRVRIVHSRALHPVAQTNVSV